MDRFVRRFGIVAVLIVLAGVTTGRATDLAEGVTLYEAGNVTEARAVFSAIAKSDPGNADAAYHLGVTQMESGQLDAAIESFETAVELDDSQSRFYQRLGEALGSKAGEVGVLKQLGMAGRIHDAFERAVALDGDNIDARFGLIFFYLNAPGIAGGSQSKALAQAEAILVRNPAGGHRAMAMVYVQQEEHEKAEDAYRAALEADPLERDNYLGFGIYLTESERYADAMEIYDAWLGKHPADMNIVYQVGRTASISGEFLERGRNSMEAYAAGHKPRPGDPSLAWANYRLGLILDQMGDVDAARAVLEKALELDPKHKQAKKALRGLRGH